MRGIFRWGWGSGSVLPSWIYLKRSRQRSHALLTHPNFHLSPDTECLTLAGAWVQAFLQQSFPDGIEKPIQRAVILSYHPLLCYVQLKQKCQGRQSSHALLSVLITMVRVPTLHWRPKVSKVPGNRIRAIPQDLPTLPTSPYFHHCPFWSGFAVLDLNRSLRHGSP